MKFIHTSDGAAPTQAEIAFFEQAAHKLAAGMQQGTTRRSYETVGSTGAYLVAGTPGLVNIHTVKDSPRLSVEQILSILPDAYNPTYTPPDFISGFIYSDGRTRVFPDAETGCNIPQLYPDPVVHTEYVSSDYAAKKLAVVGGKIYNSLAYPPADSEATTYSQASRKRPGYFTGHMASVVQLLLGAGRFLSPSVYKQTAKQRKLGSLADMQFGFDARTGKLDEPPLPSHFRYMKPFKKGQCRGTHNTNDPFAVEIPWDYRWTRTHGIMFGKDVTGTLSTGFIIDISDWGVYAYPIKIDPLTKYRRVQKYMTKVYPWLKEPIFNGMSVFEAFGGIPLPTYIIKSELNEAVTAGAAIRLCDTDQFYAGGEFISTMLGWAFSETTGEAANIVVKDPGEDTTMKMAQLFKLKVQGLRLVKEETDTGVRIVPAGTGGIIKVKEGNFYHPGVPPILDPCLPTQMPQFHVFEPVIGQVVSYDLRYGRKIAEAKCNAPMFCSYIKDDLHVLNYFADFSKKATNTTEDTRGECQVSGSWTHTNVAGAIKAGHFYNSIMDFRQEIAESRSKAVTNQRPAYDYTLHAQVDFFSMLCISRRLYFSHQRIESEFSGREVWTANVGTSSTDRSVYFVCTLHTKERVYKGTSTGIVFSGYGPEVRYSAFYFGYSHWAGGISPAPSASCMEPTGDHVETVESCYSGGTESLVGIVKHYVLRPNGTETCRSGEGGKVGGQYSGSGMLGNWIAVGGYKDASNDASKRFPPPYIDNKPSSEKHEATKRVYIFGAPLANGRMIAEYKASAPATDEPFDVEFAYDWCKFSFPNQCPVTPMPVCRNFYGKDFTATYNDRSWGEVRLFGNSEGLGPSAIPVGGIMK